MTVFCQFRLRSLAARALMLVIALLAANAQCLAQCISRPCHETQAAGETNQATVPPCHRHRTQPRHTHELPCVAPQFFVQDARSFVAVEQLSSQQAYLFLAAAPAPYLHALTSYARVDQLWRAEPPPDRAAQSTSILRI